MGLATILMMRSTRGKDRSVSTLIQVDDNGSIEAMPSEEEWSLSVKPSFGKGGVSDILKIMQHLRAQGQGPDERSVTDIVTIMWENAGHVRTQAIGCQVLQQLALGNKANRSLIFNAGGVCALHFAMLHHQDNPSLQECACWALELLCKRSKHRIALAPSCECVLDSVMMALDTYNDHVGVQQRGIGVLAKLAKEETYIESILDKGGIELAISVLAEHTQFHPIASVVLELLRDIACKGKDDHSTCQRIAAGIEAIIGAMNSHKLGDASIQARGIELLATLAMIEFQSTQMEMTAIFEKRTDESCDLGVSSYSPDLDDKVFSVLKERNKLPYVQQNTSLAPKWESNENFACTSIATSGGVIAIINAMNANLNDPSLQMNASILLGSLAVNAAKGLSICEAGGCDAIVAAMNEHQDHVGVQKNGCVAMANLWATDTSNNSMMVDIDHGVEAVTASMQSHPSEREIQVIGCRALLYFAIRKQKQSCEWPAEKVVDTVVSAMNYHNNDSEVQEVGGKVVASVALTVTGRQSIQSEGCLNSLLGILASPTVSISAKIGCCTALLNLSAHDNCRTSLAEAGAIKDLIKFMKDHHRICKAADLAILILHNICLSPELCVKVATAGGIRSIIDVMKTHPDCASVQASGCDTLWALGMCGSAVQADIASRGGIDVIVSALAAFKSSTRVQMRGYMTLVGLAECKSSIIRAQLAAALDMGAVSTLLVEHGGNTTLVSCCLRLLTLLVNQNRLQCPSRAVIEQVIQFMGAATHSPRVQVFGSSFLTTAYTIMKAARQPFPASDSFIGFFSSGLRSMRGKSEIVLQQLLNDLATLFQDSYFHGIAARESIDKTVVEVMKAHDSNAEIVGAGCSIYCQLSQSTAGRLYLGNVFVLESIVSSMERYPHTLGIQASAMTTFKNVSQTRSNVALLTMIGGVHAIAKTMNRHKGHTKLQTIGCILIWKLSSSAMRNADAVINAVVSAMKHNPSHKFIQKYGLQSLEILQYRSPQNRMSVVRAGGISFLTNAILHCERGRIGRIDVFRISIFLDFVGMLLLLWFFGSCNRAF